MATAANRNRNPGNIKGWDSKGNLTSYAKAMKAKGMNLSQGSEATDGGFFIKFESDADGVKAAQLWWPTVKSWARYQDKTLDQALKAYSGNGYDAKGLGLKLDGSKKLSSFTDEQLGSVMGSQLLREDRKNFERLSNEGALPDNWKNIETSQTSGTSGTTASGVKQKKWDDATPEEQSKVFEEYAKAQEKFDAATTDEERQAAKDEVKALRQEYGPRGYGAYKQDATAKKTKEELSKYGLDEVEGLSKKIEDLNISKQTLVAGQDDDEIAKIDKEIRGYQGEVQDLYVTADFLKKRDDFNALKEKAEKGGVFTAEEKLQFDKLAKQLPDTKEWWGNLQAQHAQWKDSEKHTEKLMSDIANGDDIHPYLFKTTVSQYKEAQEKSGEYTGILSNVDIDQATETIKYGFMEGLSLALNTKVPGLGTAMLASTDWLRKTMRNEELHNGPSKEDDFLAARLRGEDSLDEYLTGMDNIEKNIPGAEAYAVGGPENMFTEEDFNFPDGGDGGEGGDDTPKEETEEERKKREAEEDAARKGSATENTDAWKYEANDPFKFDDTKGNLFEQAGGLDSAMSMVQLGMGLAESGPVKIPDEERINDMTNNHIQSVLRLSKIGMPLVEQAKMRESMDEAFNTAKRAIMDASGGNRAQALSAVTNLGAARQKTALNIEIEKSKGRAAALSDYGELMKYVNNFEAVEGRTKSAREFEIEKANKEGAGKLVGSGIDGILQAVNNNKLYGKGSAYDMTNQYTQWYLQGGIKEEEDFQAGLTDVDKKLTEQSGLPSETKEAEQLNGATVMLSQGFAGKAQEALNGINGIVQSASLKRQETLAKQEDERNKLVIGENKTIGGFSEDQMEAIQNGTAPGLPDKSMILY